MRKLWFFLGIASVFLLSFSAAHAAITVTNPGDGSGKIYLRATNTSGGIILESCNLSANPGACNVGVTQDTINGNILEAEAVSGSYFSNWSGSAGSVGACSDTTRICNITGSSAGLGNAVNARFDACTTAISPATVTLPWSGGAGNVTVTAAQSGCSWTATKSHDWISITSGSSGVGSGNVNYSVSANRTTSTRTGTISVGANNFTITQAAYIGKIVVAPDPVNFGTVKVGVTSQLDVKISNIGTTPLTVSSMEITGTNKEEFSKLKSCSSIAGGSSCTIKILLTPQSAGNKTATLVINSDDPAYPVYELTLSGTASTTAAANISVNPSGITISTIDIEMGDSKNIRISNAGTGSLIINAIDAKGLNAVEFSFNNNCTVVLPGSYCDFSLIASYSSNSPKRASVVISSNATNAPKLEIPVTASANLCSGAMTISSSSTTALYAGSTGTIDITKTGESTCVWTVSSKNSWISVTPGNNTVSYTVASNTANTLRMGTISVAGHPFTIIQYGSANNFTFNDIQGSTFVDYINAIYSQGVTVGCISNTSYCPQDSVTRGQMAAFIIRALFGEEFYHTQNPYFSDVPAENTFFKYVQKMKDEGITALSGTYGVDDIVNREQMAAFIIRAKYGEAFTYTETPYYMDVPSTSVFFKYIQKMKDAAITVTTGAYQASANVTRDQMAAFLSRAFLGMK